MKLILVDLYAPLCAAWRKAFAGLPVLPLATIAFALWLGLSAAIPAVAQTPTLTSLHAFLPSPDGATPQGGLLQASDGNFYGTTIFGGAYNYGTVFTMTPDGSKTVLYAFTGGADGANPQANLIQGSDGALYGTTLFGGVNNKGAVFKITLSGSLTVLYSFSGYPTDGAEPLGALLQASDGNFYGTTYRGGAHDQGTVFKITPSGTETMLYAFTGGTDGDHPIAGLIQGSDGNFYGTTFQGGAHIWGTVFKVTPAGTETVLYTFSTRSDANNPSGGLVQGSDGNFYGTTAWGGPNGYGAVFKITPSGSETILHFFAGGVDGAYPYAGLVQGADGSFYGTTESGGAYNSGIVFKITPSGTETVLHAFSGYPSDGDDPRADLILASDGNLYGATRNGGAYGCGTVFKITPSGSETVLYAFTSSDGAVPHAGVIQGSDGNLYGTTYNGGNNNNGTVFKITPDGAETLLYAFTGLPDGAYPYADLIQGSDGNFYGTTFSGGAYNEGTVFKITPAGSEIVLYSFSGYPSDGAGPSAGLIQGSDGNFYGTTFNGGANKFGALFQMTPAGSERLLYSFTGGTDGAPPYAGLIQGSDGSLYGTTQNGGAYGDGGVFRLTGVYPLPAIKGLSPSARDAGAPAFTLTVKGSQYQPFSTVHWNGSPLATTYVSATELKARVSASQLSTPGQAAITVVTGAGGGTSKAKSFTILLTTLKLTAATLAKNGDGSYTANITLKNSGYNTAPDVIITKATLGTAATLTTLPVTVGNIAAGATSNSSLSFSAAAGTSGTAVTLKVSGTFTGGKFSGSLKATLP